LGLWEDSCRYGIVPLTEAMPYSESDRAVFTSFPLRIPMMSISHSDLMPISSERSDAGPSQCEAVIDIRQEFCLLSST
jgi:hypothetical protein